MALNPAPFDVVLLVASAGAVREDDVDDLAATLGAELDGAVREREQGVVAAAADVVTGVEVGAALADEDLARADDLAAETLHSEVLGLSLIHI